MPLATYRHLCIDVNELAPMGEFWARVLGLEAEDRGDEVLLRGSTPRHSIWLERVPEPVTVKQRVHLDVHAASVDDVLALGATAADLTSFGWKLVRDPEGGELCVFEREDPPAERCYELVVDAADKESITTWWAQVLGGDLGRADGWWWLENVPDMPFEALVFQDVPEAKTVKNRIHWDVTTPDLAALVAAGARVLEPRTGDRGWTVLADPEGNEFCAWPE